MKHTSFLIALSATFACLGCPSTAPPSDDKPVVRPCTVNMGPDASTTIKCGDTEVTIDRPTDGATCTATALPDGSTSIKCGSDTILVPAGPPGASGGSGVAGSLAFLVTAEKVGTLKGEITSVMMQSAPIVNFRVTDAAGRGAIGLGAKTGANLSFLRFTIAKLVPGGDAATPKWQSYINTSVTASSSPPDLSEYAGLAPIAGPVIQGTFERNGTLEDHGDGNYTYTFATNVSAVTSPQAVSFDASLTHRLGLQLSGTTSTSIVLPPLNLVFDFRPDGQPITTTRQIAIISSCNECHERLVAHGSRFELQLCVTCHNPGLHDPETGSDLNFPYMIHAIHGASKRKENPIIPSFVVVGFNNAIADFTGVGLPQQVNNCRKCHNVADAATPQGNAWQELPSREVCTGCHALPGETPTTPEHADLPNDQCRLCHTPSKIEAVHQTDNATLNNPLIPEGEGGALPRGFAYQIRSVTLDVNRYPVVTFAVLHDPNINDNNPINPADPALLPNPTPYAFLDLFNLPAGLTGSPQFLLAYNAPDSDPSWRANQLYAVGDRVISNGNVYVAAVEGTSALAATAPSGNVDGEIEGTVTWNYVGAPPPLEEASEDFDNYNPAQLNNAAQPLTLNLSALPAGPVGATNAPEQVVLDGKPYYQVTLKASGALSMAVPEGAKLVSVSLQSYYSQANYFGPSLALARHTQSAVATVSGAGLVSRREVVESGKCANCHEWFEGHGGSRVLTQFDGVQVCVNCHNPSLTSSGRSSPVNAVGSDALRLTAAGYNPLDSLTWPETSNNFKDMVHGIHSGDERANPLRFVRYQSSTAYYYDFAEVTYPAPLSSCLKCHKAGTYTTEAAEGRAVSTHFIGGFPVETKASINARRLHVPNDTDLVVSPIAAACVSCHDGELSKAHMTQNGASLLVPRSSVSDVETCSICHGVGRVADVELVHAH